MPKVCYRPIQRTTPEFAAVVVRANKVIEEYKAQGYDLTLRQLYYQFVSRGWIPNKDSEYKKLGDAISRARYAGLVDWSAITDRTRNLRGNSHWGSPADIINASAYSYREELWASQGIRVEVWIEKDALVGVIAGACKSLDVDYFSCRGYTSASEIWGAAQRLMKYRMAEQVPVIFHLGDHDPSGIDMSRDIKQRCTEFMEHHGCEGPLFYRLALNMNQIEQYSPPPNPAKLTDTRSTAYIAQYGDESWELDALEPVVISQLITDRVLALRDEEAWSAALSKQETNRATLDYMASHWSQVADYVKEHMSENGD